VVAALSLLRLLKGRQRLLRAGDIAVLQRLPDLIERLGKRRVRGRGRTLTAALQIDQRRIGLLRIRKVSGTDVAEELVERLTEVCLAIGGGLGGVGRGVGNG
jgi:hypothetical protein